MAANVVAAVLAVVLPVMAWGFRVETFVVIGALFGTVLRAFGTKATAVLSIGVLLILFAVVALVVWKWSVVAPLLASWGAWATVIIGAAFLVLASIGSYAACRRATV